MSTGLWDRQGANIESRYKEMYGLELSVYIPAALIARLISPEWDLNDSTVNDFFASYLTQIDFVVRHFENQ